MATHINTSPAKPSLRRAMLAGFAGAVAALSAQAPAQPNHGAPAGASPEIGAAVAACWARVAECNAPGADDETVDAKCEEINAAAARIAAVPCRSLADMAAKLAFFVAVAQETRALGYMTAAEGSVLLAVEADMRAFVGGAA